MLLLFLVWIAHLLLIERNIYVVDADIQVGPLNTVGTVGHIVHFSCLPDHSSCDEVKWSFVDNNDQTSIVYANGKVHSAFETKYSVTFLSDGNCQLSITNVQLSDAGEIACEHGYSRKRSALAVIESLPIIQTDIASSRSVVNGDKVNVSCSLSFNSPVEVSLLMTEDGQFIEGSEVKQQLSSSNTIIHKSVILTANRPQFGPFQCRFVPKQTKPSGTWASNSLEAQSEVLPSVIVHYPVRLLVPAVTSFSEDQRVGVKCLADGYPPPTYKWLMFPENKTVSNDSVLFYDVSINASYQCVASNVINGKMYSVFSDQLPISDLVGITSKLWKTAFTAILSAAIIIIIIIISIIGIAILAKLWKKKKRSATSMTKATKDAECERMLQMNSVPSSQPPSQLPFQHPQLPHQPSSSSVPQPNTKHIPAPSSVPVVLRTMPSNITTSYNTDRVGSSPHCLNTASQGPGKFTSNASGRESTEVTYAELTAPVKPPRATTRVSDTVYAPIASA